MADLDSAEVVRELAEGEEGVTVLAKSADFPRLFALKCRADGYPEDFGGAARYSGSDSQPGRVKTIFASRRKNF